jgi:Carboxypeptidase regulatory-like domain
LIVTMLMFAIVLAAAVQVAAPTPAAAGSLVGCMSDTTTQRVPGATIVAKTGGVQRTTVADGAGCYELKDLPPATYRVTARLLGFDNVTRDRVVLAPATVAQLDFTMRVSSICECVGFGGTLADQWDHADAVLHVRLMDSEPAPSTPQGYYRHSATVLSTVKQPTGPRPGAIFVLQNQRSGIPGPYDVGQELVAFLESSGSDAFRITNDEPGLVVPTGSHDPAMVFLVQDGRIQRAPSEFSRYVGMPIDSFLEELRTLSRRK